MEGQPASRECGPIALLAGQQQHSNGAGQVEQDDNAQQASNDSCNGTCGTLSNTRALWGQGVRQQQQRRQQQRRWRQ
jgi:hypothetical protein